MALDIDGLKAYQAALAALTEKLGELPQPIKGGRAAALGTLISMRRRIDILVVASENRPLTDIDHSDVSRDVNSIQWLRDTDWVWQDFSGVEFDLNGGSGPLAYQSALDALRQNLMKAIG
ncbi:hypothetical protein Q1W73_12715 [Asticcacaulis sp. ZE23SCel15]|uniref:hypothetical protein n=1 Tax=Asticcacaulis sp. ZE23SCel15 TaxID=3059027 RepID=UPI0026602C2B|nr:hypothetical protein [Asticcacaulis sp. ZE23SCel15]WKL56542.1 hypothetical protein Q1W73_12715 [Asticcacaulis sp. ZE23SCel15]